MIRPLSRTLMAAVVGLLAGAGSVAAWYARSPAAVIDFERDLPPIVEGVHGVERAGASVFAWTSDRASLSLPGADRRVPWTCVIRLRGARPPSVPAADLTIAVDGVAVASRRLANHPYADVSVAVPARASVDGLHLAFTVTPPFVPGPADRRRLGAQVTALSCAPDGAVRAPARALAAGGLTAAAFGAALGLIGLGTAGAAGGAILVGIAAGYPIAWAAGPYGEFTTTAWLASLWVGAGLVALTGACRLARGTPPAIAARAAIALTGGLLLVETLGLLHPSKALVDAVFHAHRLEWVMEGRYFFTQPMPSGVRFPYAIALYVVSLPLGWAFENHVIVLKMVVLVARAAAGLLLYPVVVRAWADRAGAVAAVGLFHLAPLPFIVIGNANMTYAFGHSAAVAAMAAAVLVGTSGGSRQAAAGLFAAGALAFLSHVGIFPLLAAVLLATAAGFRWLGGPALRLAARSVAAAAILAAVFSVVVYYGHFGEAYRTLAAVRARPAAAAAAGTPTGGAAPAGGVVGRPAALTLAERVRSAGNLAVRGVGWPLLVMAGAGLWIGRRSRDALAILVAATLAVAAAFEAASIVAPVEPAFWRYTAEFLSRVNYVALPAVVVLAGRAAAWGWAAGAFGRLAAVAGTALAVAGAASAWRGWLG